MYVSIIEPGQQQFAPGINRSSCGTAPYLHVRVGTDRHNALSEHCDGLRHRQALIARPDLGIGDNEISALRLSRGKPGMQCAQQENTNALHYCFLHIKDCFTTRKICGYRCPHLSLVRSTSKKVFFTRNSFTLYSAL
jgi:hypothetical protein